VVLYNDAIMRQMILCFSPLVANQLKWLKALVNTVLPLVAHRRPTAGQCPVFLSYRHIHHILWMLSNDLGLIIKGEKRKQRCHCGCCKHNTERSNRHTSISRNNKDNNYIHLTQVKGAYSSSLTDLRAMGSHLPYWITQVNVPHLNPSQTGWYSTYIPRRFDLGGWLHAKTAYLLTDSYPSQH